MNEYIWLFPILFIFHDMEEIIGLGPWLTKNRGFLEKKYPKILSTYSPYSTEGMAAAVLEELVLCLVICIIARVSSFYGIWLGGFIAYTLHLVIHLLQTIVIRKYIPAFITSILCLPVSIWVIQESIKLNSFSGIELYLYSAIGMLVVVVNLKLAHGIIRAFTRKLEAS